MASDSAGMMMSSTALVLKASVIAAAMAEESITGSFVAVVAHVLDEVWRSLGGITLQSPMVTRTPPRNGCKSTEVEYAQVT